MKLFLIRQGVVRGYDTYDSAVVSAENEEDARTIHPSEYVTHVSNGKWMGTYQGGLNFGKEYENEMTCWVRYSEIDEVDAILIGESNVPRGVVLASFNAG